MTITQWVRCVVLHWHDDELVATQHRLFFRCLTCGSESPGFQFDTPRPIAKGKRVLRFRRRMAADAPAPQEAVILPPMERRENRAAATGGESPHAHPDDVCGKT